MAVFAEHAKGEAGILEGVNDPKQATAFAVKLPGLLDAAEVAARGIAGFHRTHTPANVFVRESFKMRLKFH